MSVKIDDFKDFSPSDYLREYYSTIGKENAFLLEFLHATYYKFPIGGNLIEIGGGPTLYQLISASEVVESITFAEFHPDNLKVLKDWLKNNDSAFDWSPFLEYVKNLEGINSIDILEKRMRKKITRVIPCDLFNENPTSKSEKFDIISMNFCAESITNTKEDFEKVMKNCLSLLKDGGYLIMTALKGANYYRVGQKNFPAYAITEDYLLNFLEKRNFSIITKNQISAENNRDYTGIIGVCAQLKAPLDQNKTPIFDAVMNHINNKVTPFHVPGHKAGKGNRDLTQALGEKVLQMDLNSMSDIDDLSQPLSCIKEAHDLAASLFCANKAYFLVNGTTCGIQAMILSQFRPKNKILLPRNLHKSAFNAIILAGVTPVYIPIHYNNEYKISGAPQKEVIEKILEEQPDIKGVLLLNPSYYGVCGDLKAIVEICHKRNKIVLVDEAHGAHFYFHDDLPITAMEAGADMSVVSMHKTGGSLTQSSILLVNKNKISELDVKRTLNMLTSTSASYLLMISLDIARRQMALHGQKLVEKNLKIARYLREKINHIPGLKSYGKNICDAKKGINHLDETKVFINIRGWNITGFQLERLLANEYQIQIELSDMYYIFVLITFADNEESVNKLVNSLQELSSKYFNIKKRKTVEFIEPGLPQVVLHPQKAFYANRVAMDLENSIGKIAAEPIMVYPPGIPVVLAGEKISENIQKYLINLKNQNVVFQGVADPKLDTILIVEEKKTQLTMQ